MTDRTWTLPERRKALTRKEYAELAGRTFGRWTVISFARKGHHPRWLCRCECGTEREVESVHLKSGKSKSCGCLKREVTAKLRRKHGGAETSEYGIWLNIKFRTGNPEHRNGKEYAGRGITMCERWHNSFADFIFDMGPRPSSKHSIDRIDNNGNYEPGNCRWATFKTQMRNTRSNRMVQFEGREMSLVEASELSGVNYDTLKWRLNAGKDPLAPVRRTNGSR